MPTLALIFLIMSILCIIIPIIICYKIFSKGAKESLLQGLSYVSMLTFSPLSISTAGVQLSIQTVLIVFLFIELAIGITYACMNFSFIKKNIQSHDHTWFFYYFFFFRFFCYFYFNFDFYKEEKIIILEIEIKVFYLCILSIYIILFSFGIFFSIVFEYIFYKYKKFQIGIIYAFIYQLFVYSSNCLVAFINWIIFIMIICPIINIIIGLLAWKFYSTDEEINVENNTTSSNELINQS